MGGDDYVIDGNGGWGTQSEALAWYREALKQERERADYAWRNTQTIEAARQEEMRQRDAAKAEVEKLRGFLRDCQSIAQEHGGCDLWDACDNDGKLYQSQALADAMKPQNVRGEGPPEARSAVGNLQAQLAGGPSRPKGWASGEEAL